MTCRFSGLQNIGAREEQEDAFGFSTSSDEHFLQHAGFVAVVADGVGGLQHGARAARTAVGTFLSCYHGKAVDEGIPVALRRSALDAHNAVCRIAAEVAGQPAAATLVAVAVRGAELHWISAGDSRAYLVRQRSLAQLTTDHNYGTQLDIESQSGRRVAPGPNSPRRDVLTSCLGMPGELVLDGSFRPLPLSCGDQIVLCTDGVYGTVNEARIASLVGASPASDCTRLLQAVQDARREGQDNATVVVLQPFPAPRFRLGLILGRLWRWNTGSVGQADSGHRHGMLLGILQAGPEPATGSLV